jgi:hypothetical protein
MDERLGDDGGTATQKTGEKSRDILIVWDCIGDLATYDLYNITFAIYHIVLAMQRNRNSFHSLLLSLTIVLTLPFDAHSFSGISHCTFCTATRTSF